MDNARMSEETVGVVFGIMLSAPGYCKHYSGVRKGGALSLLLPFCSDAGPMFV